jgi:uncharacterized membrane protein
MGRMPLGSGAAWALTIAVFVATIVEMVEAVTIVVAMGMTRSWRSAIAGTVTALVGLVIFTAAAGYALVTWLPEAALQVAIGGLLLIFGFQWLRKAILRSAGRKGMHDEAEIFAKQSATARSAASKSFLGLDYFAFVVSLKGVFLEGVEVVFIVITFGLNARNMPVAVVAATVAAVLVLIAAIAAHGPLTRVPENTLKYAVAILLSTFGTFWVIEGLGIFRSSHQPLEWPGGNLALIVVLAGWLALSRVLVWAFRERPATPVNNAATSGPRSADLTTEGVAR